jgi:hypothetical protein
VKLGSLELGKGESTSETNLSGIFLGLAVDNGAELLDWARGHGSSLGGSSQSTSLLGSGLVVVHANLEGSTRRLAVLLVEVKVRDDIVMLDHGCELCETGLGEERKMWG